MSYKKPLIYISIFIIGYFMFFHKYSYYSFDKVEHYKIGSALNDTKLNDDNKKLINEIILEWDRPSGLNDSIFFKVVKENSTLKNIKTEYFDELNMYFKQQSCNQILSSMCIVHFNDILVFYKNEEITGIAKICFGCKESILIGTNLNTSTFGQCGIYEKLKQLLNFN